MTEQEREDLLTAKLMLVEVKKALSKMLENQEVLTELRLDADSNKKFRERFEEKVLALVTQRLNTIQFEADLNKQIQNQTKEYLNKKEVRKEFTADVKGIIEDEMAGLQLSLFWKITAFVGTVLMAIFGIVLKGWFNGN